MTRRTFRKKRPKLTVGDAAIEGTVVKYFPAKQQGVIAPSNGAAQIFFYMKDVPRERMKCVGVGRKVFFDVVQRGVIKRKTHTRPRLAAVIRTSR